MINKFSLLITIALLLAACSGTTVVLVPDADGKVGEVSVDTQAGSTVLTKANESTEASKADKKPSDPETLSEQEVQSMFAKTLAKEPIPPARHRLYFGMGDTQLNPESEHEIDSIIADINTRKSCDLSVIGHSDRVGDNNSNRGISMQRAENVAAALVAKGMAENCFDIRYYGENDPAVPTEDEVAEPKNRRVEVEIR
jgi:outer membrane protein OmpA-like peptidoglycan-associated protein